MPGLLPRHCSLSQTTEMSHGWELPWHKGIFTLKFINSFEIQSFLSCGVGTWTSKDVFSLAALLRQKLEVGTSWRSRSISCLDTSPAPAPGLVRNPTPLTEIGSEGSVGINKPVRFERQFCQKIVLPTTAPFCHLENSAWRGRQEWRGMSWGCSYVGSLACDPKFSNTAIMLLDHKSWGLFPLDYVWHEIRFLLCVSHLQLVLFWSLRPKHL